MMDPWATTADDPFAAPSAPTNTFDNTGFDFSAFNESSQDGFFSQPASEAHPVPETATASADLFGGDNPFTDATIDTAAVDPWLAAQPGFDAGFDEGHGEVAHHDAEPLPSNDSFFKSEVAVHESTAHQNEADNAHSHAAFEADNSQYSVTDAPAASFGELVTPMAAAAEFPSDQVFDDSGNTEFDIVNKHETTALNASDVLNSAENGAALAPEYSREDVGVADTSSPVTTRADSHMIHASFYTNATQDATAFADIHTSHPSELSTAPVEPLAEPVVIENYFEAAAGESQADTHTENTEYTQQHAEQYAEPHTQNVIHSEHDEPAHVAELPASPVREEESVSQFSTPAVSPSKYTQQYAQSPQIEQQLQHHAVDTPAPAVVPAIESPVAAVPAPVTSPSAAGSFALSALVAPSKPGQPTLTLATIDSLTVAWPSVDNATGYYCDFEGRSQTGVDGPTAAEGAWVGNGSRVVVGGSALLTSTKAKVTGLQKNSLYVVRITAVRKRRVMLPDGTALEQTLESEPSSPSSFLRTLNPGAEIARLTDTNAKLTAENERIPVLEGALADLEALRQEEVSALSEELSTTRDQLTQAISEIDRLQTALASKIRELDAAQVDIKSLNTTLQTRSGELGESRAECRHLRDVIASKTDDIAKNHAEIQRLEETVQTKVADLDKAAAEAGRLEKIISDRDAEITSLLGRVSDLESQLQNKEKSRQDLSSRLAAQSAQLSTLSGDKDILVNKLTEDLAKVMGELQRVQNQLHKAQDTVAYLEPFARVVLDLRERQAAWDAAHEAAGHTGGGGAIGSPFGKMSALRKLGPRPTLTL